jgi:anthranilate phosphoribosyltransferase
MTPTDPVAAALRALAEGRDLDAVHAEDAFSQVMRGEASPVQMSALLMGLRVKGESTAELVGAVRALRGAMVTVEAPAGATLVDTCGTGGGSMTTFNISTAAAFVAAGAGVHVAKHGNRSFTSQSGSADVLEALGVSLPPTRERAARLLAACRMTFLFAPLFHPAMKHVGPVRRELGLTTMMNLLGPLANPAGVRRQVVGVADPARAGLLAEALAALDAVHALVVHARDGMDEIAPDGPTDVWEVRGGSVRNWTLDPSDLGLPTGGRGLAGGAPDHNAAIVRDVLEGRDTSVRLGAVLINSAAALIVAGVAAQWREAVDQARASVTGGHAAEVLGALVQESRAEQ